MIKARPRLTTPLSALALAGAMAVFAVSPATAQVATNLKCNGCVNGKDVKNDSLRSKDIKNGAIRSADMGANISLGTAGDDGDLGVKNAAGAESVSLDGATGNVTNLFSNTAGASNGLVKAWARMNGDGTVRTCWRCSADPAVTGRLAAGVYFVDFTPLSTDISLRPRSAVIDSHETGAGVINQIGLTGDPVDLSRVAVGIENDSGTQVDAGFTLIIY